MAESDPIPHVTGNDLRAALARDGQPRPRRLNVLLDSAPEASEAPRSPAWDWDASVEAELTELRTTLDRLRGELDTAKGETARAVEQASQLRGALNRLASARLWRRGQVVGELRDRALVD